MKPYVHLCQYFAEFLLLREMFHTKFVEKIRTHFIYNNFLSVNRAVHELMWKNVVGPDRPQMTIQYGACALHVGQLRLKTRTQHM
jgi:hypothetical protein